jgi:hypothetical protein
VAIENPFPSVRGPLLTSLIALAGSPEYLSTIESQLTAIARQTVDRVRAADFASVTVIGEALPVSVAVGDALIRAVDTIERSETAEPFEGTIRWPGFHEQASGIGLRASVAVPLHTGCGRPVAVLHAYGRDPAAMAPLIGGICTVRGLVLEGAPELTDDGGRELIAGYAEALSIRERIHQALTVIMEEDRGTADDAYVTLCIHAAHAGTDLAAAAAAFLPTRE